MAIFKAIDPKKYKAKGIANIVNYVLRKHRESLSHEDKLVYCGINVDPCRAAEEMEKTKDFWNKHGGREYYHFVQSFPPDENITIKQANDITKKFVMSCPEFDDYEVLIATHHDKKNHIDSHIIVNSVSYSTGYKFHYTRARLAEWKRKQDGMNVSLGLKKAPEKGFTFDGEKRAEMVSNNRKTYEVVKKALEKKKESYIVNCALSILRNSKTAISKEDFAEKMRSDGFDVEWNEKRKHIVFSDIKRKANGEKKCKIRLSTLFKTFNYQEFTKEDLENEFTRNGERTAGIKPQHAVGLDSNGHAADKASAAAFGQEWLSVFGQPAQDVSDKTGIEHHQIQQGAVERRGKRADGNRKKRNRSKAPEGIEI